jgi:hypothetical protein
MLLPCEMGFWYSALNARFLLGFDEFCKKTAVFCNSDHNREYLAAPGPILALENLHVSTK